jgi:2-polyprenyl-6-methoxyphenol hydroxylase-like FAD-dependent oxidoreductase
MSFAHPDYAPEDFRLTFLDRWYAYRLPAVGRMKDKFGGGDRFLASNVFVNNLKQYPREKFRVVTTHMKQPKEEISVLIKYADSLDLNRVEELNDVFIGPYFESKEQLKAAWDMGYGDKFEQVETPTFRLGNALLIGDAAHGFESTGDLINLGLTSVGALVEMINSSQNIPSTLEEYDQTIGKNLRFYARYALRRSYEKIGFEVGSIEFASRLGLAKRHPGLFGIYADDFEIQRSMDDYRRDKRNSALLVLGLALIPILLIGWILF